MPGDALSVAKTVVVPCSGELGVPTPAIDPAPSTTSHTPVTVDDDDDDDCIDIETISDDDDSVVDVESVDDDTDDCAVVGEESGAEIPDDKKSVARVPLPPCSSVLGQGRFVQAVMTEVSTDPVPSPMSVAGTLPAPPPPQSSHPFSIQAILNRDVFMGSDTDRADSASQDRLAPESLNTQGSGASVAQDLGLLSCLMSPETSTNPGPDPTSLVPVFDDTPSTSTSTSSSHLVGSLSSFQPSLSESQASATLSSSGGISNSGFSLILSQSSGGRRVSKLDELLPKRMNSLAPSQSDSHCQFETKIKGLEQGKETELEIKGGLDGVEERVDSAVDYQKGNSDELDKSSTDHQSVDRSSEQEKEKGENKEGLIKDAKDSEGEENHKLEILDLPNTQVDDVDKSLGDEKGENNLNFTDAEGIDNVQDILSSTCVDSDDIAIKQYDSNHTNLTLESTSNQNCGEVKGCDSGTNESRVLFSLPNNDTVDKDSARLSPACDKDLHNEDQETSASLERYSRNVPFETQLSVVDHAFDQKQDQTVTVSSNACSNLLKETNTCITSTLDNKLQQKPNILESVSIKDSPLVQGDLETDQPCSSTTESSDQNGEELAMDSEHQFAIDNYSDMLRFDNDDERKMCTSPSASSDRDTEAGMNSEDATLDSADVPFDCTAVTLNGEVLSRDSGDRPKGVGITLVADSGTDTVDQKSEEEEMDTL